MITELTPEQTVAGPGLYKCSMDHYHSQDICPGPSVSSTGLRTAALKSPHAFWKTWDGNPDRYPKKDDNPSLTLGKAAHALILGDEVFDETFVYVPKDAPQRPTAAQIAAFERKGEWSENAAPRAEFWTEFDKRAKGRLLLKQEQVEHIQYMAESLNSSPMAVEVLTSDMIEISMIWQDPISGIWLKSRPDCLPTNGFDFSDLKTFSPRGSDLILAAQRSVTDYGYALQMAMAIMGTEEVMAQSAERCALIFIQSSPPYEVIVIELDSESLYWAKVLLRDGLNKVAHGLKTGDWPFGAQEIVTYGYPPSMLHRFGELQEAGELPNLEAVI